MKKVLHITVILVLLGLAVKQFLKIRNEDSMAKLEAVPEAWIQNLQKQWPQIVLTHDASFKEHGDLQGASAFLMRLPDQQVIAVTAKHLFGFAGGLSNMRVSYIDESMQSWKLHARGKPDPFVEVQGLLGDPKRYGTFDDVVALRLKSRTNDFPFHALTFRKSAVIRSHRIAITPCAS